MSSWNMILIPLSNNRNPTRPSETEAFFMQTTLYFTIIVYDFRYNLKLSRLLYPIKKPFHY